MGMGREDENEDNGDLPVVYVLWPFSVERRALIN